MNRLVSLLALLALLFCSQLPAFAQNSAEASATRPQVSGEIRKVDTAAGKLTIRHDEIPNLGMPGMTMVFRVAAPALISQVKNGEQILFTADRIDGALTVMSIEAK